MTLGPVLFGLSGCAESVAVRAPETPDTPAVEENDALTLADFQVFPEDDDSWTERDTIACAGKTKGYIYTNESFGFGTISFEYRYPDDLAEDVIPNTGLLLLIEPPHKKWPRCIEAQGKQSEAGQLKGNGGVTDLNPQFDETALAESIHPPGEWNVVEVMIAASGVVAKWNGVETARCELGGLTTGPFGLQSEGNPVEFRNISFRAAD